MKCEKCGKYTATTHIHTVIGGRATDMHICGYCASGSGLRRFGRLGMMNIMAAALEDDSNDLKKAQGYENACPQCGITFSEIASSGKLGCADCYKTFYKKLYPSLRRTHGATHHQGKIPISSSPRLSSTSRIDELKKQLKDAVEVENFELAAKLRDEIKLLKESSRDE